jgi:phenylacetate-coenzyme A ligase PaaK-like adenylate-forming protein
VECGIHDGCHIRESDLLIEIIDPKTGKVLPDGECGEVVLTTLGREAMPLIRYRTGDIASLDRSGCACGGVTARLKNIRGRMERCRLSSGALLYSQDIDEYLFEVPGLLDYRVLLATAETTGVDRLELELQALPGSGRIADELVLSLGRVPAIRTSLADATLELGGVRQVAAFAAVHTQKRTIVDQRTQGETHAPCS